MKAKTIIFSVLFLTINLLINLKCPSTKYRNVSRDAINRLLNILKYIDTCEFITKKKRVTVSLNSSLKVIKYSVTMKAIVERSAVKLLLYSI